MGASRLLKKAANELAQRAAKGDGLALDHASRMQRAKAMGFDVDNTMYHGTGNLDGLTSFERKHTGIGADQYGPGFYLTSSPHQASGYAQDAYRGNGKISGDSKGVISAKTGGNLLDLDGTKARNMADAFELNADQVRQMLRESDALKRGVDSDDMNPLGDYYESFWDSGPEDWMIDDLAEQYAGRNPEELTDLFDDNEKFLDELGKATGYDGLRINWPDTSHEVHWNPSNIRSVNATFDPAKKSSANLLASLAPMAVGAGMMAQSDNSSAASRALKSEDRMGDLLQYGQQQTMQNEEYPMLENAANFIDKYTQTPIGSPLEGTSNYLREFGRGDRNKTNKLLNALGLSLDFL